MHPTQGQATTSGAGRSTAYQQIVDGLLSDPALKHVSFDLSWDEVAKYAVATPETVERVAEMFNAHPEQFLFGTDNVAPPDQATRATSCGRRYGRS